MDLRLSRTLLKTVLPLLLVSVGHPTRAKEESNSYYFIPSVFYQPETRVVLGATALAVMRTIRETPEIPVSTLNVALLLTQNKQLSLFVTPNFFSPSGDYEFRSATRVDYFPSDFYGIGSELPESAKESYTSKAINTNFFLLASLGSTWRAGPFAEVQAYGVVDPTPGKWLSAGQIAGSQGAFLMGGGPCLEWNTLDNGFSPERGNRLQLTLAHFPRALLSTHPYSRFLIDWRYFYKLHDGHVLALQYLFRSAWGDVPFQAMSGPGFGVLRGVEQGRALDRAISVMQLEYRFPLYRKLSGVGFAGLSRVSSGLGFLPTEKVIRAGGGGLRWRVDEEHKVNVRADVALSSLGSGFYAALGEAF